MKQDIVNSEWNLISSVLSKKQCVYIIVLYVIKLNRSMIQISTGNLIFYALKSGKNLTTNGNCLHHMSSQISMCEHFTAICIYTYTGN